MTATSGGPWRAGGHAAANGNCPEQSSPDHRELPRTAGHTGKKYTGLLGCSPYEGSARKCLSRSWLRATPVHSLGGGGDTTGTGSSSHKNCHESHRQGFSFVVKPILAISISLHFKNRTEAMKLIENQ